MSYLLYSPEQFRLSATIQTIAAQRGRALVTVSTFEELLANLDDEQVDVLLLAPGALRQAPEALSRLLPRIADRVLVIAFVEPDQQHLPEAPIPESAAGVLMAGEASQQIVWSLERLLEQPGVAGGPASAAEAESAAAAARENLDAALFSDPIDDQVMALHLARRQTAAGVPTAAFRLSPYRAHYPITYVSMGISAITGDRPCDLAGHSLTRIADRVYTAPCQLEAMQRALDMQRAATVSLQARRRDGRLRSTRVQLRPYYSTWGVLQSFVGLIWPITPADGHGHSAWSLGPFRRDQPSEQRL